MVWGHQFLKRSAWIPKFPILSWGEPNRGWLAQFSSAVIEAAWVFIFPFSVDLSCSRRRVARLASMYLEGGSALSRLPESTVFSPSCSPLEHP